jgi:hypothetical protein
MESPIFRHMPALAFRGGSNEKDEIGVTQKGKVLPLSEVKAGPGVYGLADTVECQGLFAFPQGIRHNAGIHRAHVA